MRKDQSAGDAGTGQADEPGAKEVRRLIALYAAGQLRPAEIRARHLIREFPGSPVLYNILGAAQTGQGRPDDAIATYRQVLKFKPDYAEAHGNLGIAFKALGKFEAAIVSYRDAVRLKPDYAEAHSNLAAALQNLGRLEDAVASYRRALEIEPGFVEDHNNLGIALHELGRPDEAVACYREAVKLKPGFAEAHYNLGRALQELGLIDEAVASYEHANKARPDHAKAFSRCAFLSRVMCDWKSFAANRRDWIERVRAGRLTTNPGAFLSVSDHPEDQLKCAQLYTKSLFEAGARPAAVKAKSTDQRVRIAYLSADFHMHATAHLMAELFERHDRDRFEIIGVSWGVDDNSPMHQRVRQAFDEVLDVREDSDETVAEMIAERGVHIAVDLKGYTDDCRPGILAHRPAPVQVSYLGYPGTMGADFIDYIVVDRFVAPADQQQYFSERLVHMPDCYQVNDSKRQIATRTPPKPQHGLPETGFIFCCFNNNYKITPDIFDIWMRLLTATPDSVLWLLGDNRWAHQNLRREAETRDVDPDRLVFAPRMQPADHLARQRLADLFLDTLPYTAHTTASDALWAGLPLLTCTGQTFASRVAGSILQTAGMAELVTDSLEDYEALALRLAANPDELGEIRADLLKNRENIPLFNCERFCRNLESAYQTMFKTWAEGSPPEAFAVKPVA